MALPEKEQRQLAEIERWLVQEDPRLARRLAESRPTATFTLVLAVLGILTLSAVGLVLMVFGVQLASPVLVIVGALLTVVLPAMLSWRLWSGRR
ncbi:MAG: DUF3040 domain-containing protein [Pseudonocardiaceae bacterium]|nr:DUF3040 domain-containing protein [Pseudonocardiaceae bacterium]